MASGNLEKLKQIVADALELDVDKREAFIQQACANNADLLQQVRSLMAAQMPPPPAGSSPPPNQTAHLPQRPKPRPRTVAVR